MLDWLGQEPGRRRRAMAALVREFLTKDGKPRAASAFVNEGSPTRSPIC